MYFFSRKLLTTVFILFVVSSLLNDAAAQDKPLLSEAIRTAVDANGVEAAKQQFASMNPSERELYNVDMGGISKLTTAYLEDGNMEALMAISEISAPFIQDMVAQSMEQYGSEMKQMAEQRTSEREEERTDEREQSVIEHQGQPRDDLDRFKGVYGDPADNVSTRQLWVNVSCDGYLVSGAMWGDASPWWMRSESENVFTLEDSFNNIRMEFGTSGGTNEMTHNLDFMVSPLQRVGPLPDEWNSCFERYR